MENILARILQLFKTQNIPKEIFLTLEFETNIISAQAFEIIGKKVVVLSSTEKKYNSDDENETIRAVNSVVTYLEENVSDLKKTVFGVPSEWVEEGKIKDKYQKILKKISSELDLAPVGFVVTQDAIMYYLNQEEGVPATAVLVGVLEREVVVSVVRAGRLHGVIRKPILSNISESVKLALKEFVNIEVFPSRMLIYGFSNNLEDVKQELISYPWLQNIDFLHFPKMEVLYAAKDVVTMSYSGVVKVEKIEPKKTTYYDYNKNHFSDANLSDMDEENKDADQEKETSVDLPSEEIKPGEAIAELGTKDDIGFIENEDILEKADNFEAIDHDFELDKSISETDIKDDDGERKAEEWIEEKKTEIKSPTKTQVLKIPDLHFSLTFMQNLKLPKVKISGFENSFLVSFFRNRSVGKVFVMGMMVLIILAVGLGVLYFNILKANIVLVVEPKILEKSTEVIASSAVSLIDESKKIIPAKLLEVTESGSMTTSSTGTKQTGEKAKGQVVIYNKTLSDKNFPAGTIIVSDNLKFTTDSSASVSAQSVTETGGGATISYGKVKVNVTATSYGTKYNLPANTSFKIGDSTLGTFEAKTETALSGGTSRDILVVSKEDQDKLLKKLSQDLLDKAKKELDTKQDSSSHIISSSIESSIVKKKFNKDIDSEGKDFTLELEMKFKGLTYNDQDLKGLMERLTTNEIPGDYSYRSQNAENVVEEKEVKKDGSVLLAVKYTARLLPKIDPLEIRNSLKGKNITSGKKYLELFKNVKSFDISFTPKLPSFLLTFPQIAQNISVEITSK